MDEKNRIAWVINYLKKERGLKDQQLAEKWNIDKNTVAAYRRAKGIAKGNVLASLAKEFSINGEWLITGNGEPFPGARGKYPEVCGGPPISQAVYDRIDQATKAAMAREAQVKYSNTENQQIDIAIGKAYRVLAADNALSSALFLIIHQFAAALDADIELQKCKKELVDLREEFEVLKRKVDRLEAVPTEQKEAV